MHQNHDQISGLSVSNLFICGLKAYLVIFGSQLLNLYNNVAVCRFELLGIPLGMSPRAIAESEEEVEM